ncbi:MAG: alanine dehydrogenase [Betaproteobacteria bacterium RIFCSPLOWO2_12_FULL_62_13]|nr:MAG: alanine dehydrogenase [Betaproteobacteria bacterium RIFCSPLOWO2_12_FULL_62_13]
MRIGVPREIKNHEYRVALTPAGAKALVACGQRVSVQAGAGVKVGFPDEQYRAAGAQIVAGPQDVYACDMVIKVKELQSSEFALTHAGQILFCYHHFAPDAVLLKAMLDARVTCVAYETVTDHTGALPLLVPMSQIAGRLAPQVGAWALQMANGGSGVLLGGVPGVAPAKVVIIGGGTVGGNAARIAIGMGGEVTLADRSAARLARLEEVFGARLKTAVSSEHTVAPLAHDADLVIGAVLLPGKLAPRLLRRDDLKQMRPGSVIVDVAIDQGGICETSRPTSHSDPIYAEQGVIHYCVPNMPSAVARTATLALAQATLPYALGLAGKGLRRAITENPGLRAGLQLHAGQVTHAGLAQDTGRNFVDPLQAMA